MREHIAQYVDLRSMRTPQVWASTPCRSAPVAIVIRVLLTTRGDGLCYCTTSKRRLRRSLCGGVSSLKSPVLHSHPRRKSTPRPRARLFFDKAVRYYSLPESIVSDCDPRFTSEFCQELMTIMQVKVRTLEDILRCVVSHYGDDWSRLLPTVEYAHATLVSTSTRVSPFEVDCGRKPRSPILLPAAVACATTAVNFKRDRQRVVEFAQTTMRKAQEQQALYYNQGRRVVEFRVDYYDPDRDPTRNKLLTRWYGPFEVEQRISNNAYRLKLPRRYVDRCRHPTFNVDQLKLSPDVPEIFRSREITRSAPQLFDNEGERVYIIKELLQQRRRSGQRQWLCSRVDLPVEQNS
ncbi:hypothetical protein PsorP6_004175 [Peronosclerospora sorghi]|uniref:Uncharacterized protein n=1 Tax=Peronosclerospora sorghi TaxID=230839 RepID=A0ACC0VP35_9STRA|nr:hypothetical protein PsorP6_004175 [Peronosclerospora sorghi]